MEPVTLAAVGVVALAEGIKFLYAQAGEAIAWWRAHRDDSAAETDPVPVVDSDAIDGPLQHVAVDRQAMVRLESEMRTLRAALAPYADERAPEPVNIADQHLLAVTDGLRRALEAVLGQQIRFVGEPERESGTAVVGEIDVDRVAGYVAGVRARNIEGGSAAGRARVKTVEKDGQAFGADVEWSRNAPDR